MDEREIVVNRCRLCRACGEPFSGRGEFRPEQCPCCDSDDTAVAVTLDGASDEEIEAAVQEMRLRRLRLTGGGVEITSWDEYVKGEVLDSIKRLRARHVGRPSTEDICRDVHVWRGKQLTYESIRRAGTLLADEGLIVKRKGEYGWWRYMLPEEGGDV